MQSDEVLRRRLHGLEGQGRREVPAEADLVDRAEPAGVDRVPIGLAGDVPHHVEIQPDLPGLQHHDILGQMVVEGRSQTLQGDRTGGVDQAHLPPGVDAGIGPAGPLDMGRAPQHLGRRPAEHPLDRPKPRLNLPAVVVGAVIGDHQLDLAPAGLGGRFIRDSHVFCSDANHRVGTAQRASEKSVHRSMGILPMSGVPNASSRVWGPVAGPSWPCLPTGETPVILTGRMPVLLFKHPLRTPAASGRPRSCPLW